MACLWLFVNGQRTSHRLNSRDLKDDYYRCNPATLLHVCHRAQDLRDEPVIRRNSVRYYIFYDTIH